MSCLIFFDNGFQTLRNNFSWLQTNTSSLLSKTKQGHVNLISSCSFIDCIDFLLAPCLHLVKLSIKHTVRCSMYLVSVSPQAVFLAVLYISHLCVVCIWFKAFTRLYPGKKRAVRCFSFAAVRVKKKSLCLVLRNMIRGLSAEISDIQYTCPKITFRIAWTACGKEDIASSCLS